MAALRILALLLLATPALAAPICDTYKRIEAQLQRDYKEQAPFWGTTAGGKLMQLYVSKEGDWSIVITTGGLSCIMAVGEDLTIDKKQIMEVLSDGA